MNERLEHARQLGRRIDVDWQREDIEAQLARLHVRQRTRARRRAVAAPLAAAALTAAIFAGFSVSRETAGPAAPASCEVVAEPPRLEAAPTPVAPVALVPPAPVAAEPGAVRPRTDERRAVAPGELRAVASHEIARVDHRQPAPVAEPSHWRDDAARGDYVAAWTALARETAPLDGMQDLLLAGDVARLSGHPAAAVGPLSRAADLHPDDPRAPLAAFTLGRVHLEDLGAPRDAALAFARARSLGPGGPLAEDALAREVEAWSRAGETETARGLALTYTRLYPQGRRLRAVRQFGALGGP
jgi:transmembrane sensor